MSKYYNFNIGTKISVTLFLFILLLFTYGCNKEEPTNNEVKMPIAPSNPNPIDNARGQPTNLALSWKCSDIDSASLTYDIFLGTDNPPVTKFSSSHTVTNLSVTDLLISTRYYWNVVAKYDNGRSTSSEVWKFNTTNPPNLPSNPNPPDNAVGELTTLILSWTCNHPDNDSLKYDVYFGPNDPPTIKVTSEQSDTSLNQSGLSKSTTYYWKVVAEDNHGYTTTGQIWKFTTIASQPPLTPSSPIPADSGTNVSTSPTLNWTCSDPDNDPLTYDVYFGRDNPPTTKASSNHIGTSIVLSGLENSTTYYWKVVAKDNHNNITTGPVWTLTTSQPPSAPSSPTPANNTTNILLSTTLSWSCNDPENDPLTYDIYFRRDNATTVISWNQSGTTFVKSGLGNSITYYWWVVAKDNHNNSTIGETWSFTTAQLSNLPCPGTPTITYGSRTYNTIQIGTQCWFKENLDIGTLIAGGSNQTNNGTIEKYCYNNNSANCSTYTYGGLYQWDEAMQYTTTPGAQGICPTAWHIPTREEFQILINAVNIDGNSLKAIGQDSTSTNTSGFSVLFSGIRHDFNGGNFSFFDTNTSFWSSTIFNATNACHLSLHSNGYNIQTGASPLGGGFSIRCLKD